MRVGMRVRMQILARIQTSTFASFHQVCYDDIVCLLTLLYLLYLVYGSSLLNFFSIPIDTKTLGMCGESTWHQRNHPHLTCTEWDSHFSCAGVWTPVCGCDNLVYSNSCSANYQNGVNVLCSLNPNDQSVLPGGNCDCGATVDSVS